MKPTVLIAFGTRPEAIKLAPVVAALRAEHPEVRTVVCSTGQHREMLRQVTDLFGIKCDIQLDVMLPNQTLSGVTARLFDEIDRAVAEVKPDWLIVQGDTTTAFVGATVGFYHKIRVGHVEAGLRTGDKFRPFPEEVNRRFVTIVADAHFAPTERARRALLREYVPDEQIHLTGNTVVDAVLDVARRPYEWTSGPIRAVSVDRPIVLITAHRRESFGETFRSICAAIRELAIRHADSGVQFVYPVHLNPNVRAPVQDMLSGTGNVSLLDPLDYSSLIQLLKRSTLVLTDSGGIQEEAPAFGVPVCVMRDTTERPEGIEAGVAVLVGTRYESILETADRLLKNPAARAAMASAVNPYGDGKASQRIAEFLSAST
jgi:UDP-N-acetylglucosamine 2-epimerase (non-hydrolysing)